ncbi:MAG: patatin-like phospholipase family protein [Candidatus Sulfotelmatobacter sp.]|jgi:NTE family protein
MENAVGLVITGGGARGAYQAGVLKRIGKLKSARTEGNPFPIIGGASAGAINGAALATGCDDFASATQTLAEVWATLEPSDIFHCGLLSQAHNSLTWIFDLSFGAILGGGNARSLLDATPLRHFLSKHLDSDRIQENIKRGDLYALAISATNFNSGKSYLFIQGRKGHPLWNRIRLVTVATKITVDHVCASAAIPMVFQPVKLKTPRGSAFFGDGCLRLQQPLSPVIRLGAEKVFVIGVRCGNKESQEETTDERHPSLAQVMGVLCNVMFLDHLATDVEHLERLNQLLNDGHINQPGIKGGQKIRPLGTFVITPSVNLSDLAEQHQKDMPSLIHYFVSSLGRDAASCADLMSYLLFTPSYTRDLIEIGYHDASERIDEIEDFLYSSKEGDAENALAGETGGNVPKAGSAAKRTGNSVRSRG